MKIIEYTNGKFAVQKGLLVKEYLSTSESFWWSEQFMEKYCLFDSYEQAKEHFNTVVLRVRKKHKIK